MMSSTRLLPRLLILVLLGLAPVFGLAGHGHAQGVIVSDVGSGAGDIVPGSYQGSGSFFNRQLGTIFRFSYQNEGYGTQQGIVSLGSMKVFNLEDSATLFVDGQATLSEDFGGGFNAGIGYRELVNTGLGFDAQRIHGVSFWTDGQSTSADNFFTQLGFNLESLGDSFDARLGGYFPLDRTMIGDPTLTALDDPMFLGNNLVAEAFMRSIDTAHSVVDGELAKRIGNKEAWAFLGGYQIGGGSVDATGYRVGVRGYAMPDLALSLQVTDDDVYSTNVVFGLTWFVGRTHRGNQPCGTLLDRFREPVQRNNFIATTQVSEMVAGGDPLRDNTSGDILRFVHVDSTEGGGGDGTFENPFDSFAGVAAASQENDTIFVHAGSVVAGQYTAQNAQRILGEGGDVVHMVNTLELGILNLPETAPGALGGAVPIINGVGDVFTLADNNELNNFVVNSGIRAVVANAVASPVMRNLDINGITGDGIVLMDVTGTATIEDSVNINNAGGIGLLVDGGTDAANLAATITNAADRAVVVRNRAGGIVNLSGPITGTGQGILLEDNTDGAINFTNMLTLTGEGLFAQNNTGGTNTFSGEMVFNTGANDAVRLVDNTGATFAFTGGMDIDTTSGTGFFADGGGTIAASGTNTIDTTTGVGLDVRNMTIGATNLMFDSVNVTNGTTGINLDTLDGTGQVIVGTGTNPGDGGTLVASGTAIQLNDVNNATFSNVTVANTAVGANGVVITSVAGNEAFFSGLNITTENMGFSSIGGGELSVTGTNNITTTSGTALLVRDNVIDVAGVTFDSVTTTAGTGTGIELADLTGGTVTVGPNSGTPGEGGMLTTAGTAISVDNVAGAVFNDVTVANTTGPGVNVTGQTAGSVLFNNLAVTTTTADGVTVENNTGGTIGFDDLNVTTTTGDAVVLDNNTGATININDMVVNSTVSGNGLMASNGGSLGVTGTNTIATVAGVGLDLSGVTILGAGATFESVNVTAGTTNGIALTDLTGGIVTVGPDSGTPGDGGTLTTTDTAILVDNVAGAVFNDMTIDNSATTGEGINVTSQTAGAVRFENTNVSTSSAENAVTIAGNTAGTIEFNTLAATTTGAGDGISIDEADASTVAMNFNDITVNANGTGNGFNATGGGVTNITGTNVINSTGATALVAVDVESLSVANLTINNTTAQGVDVSGLNDATDTVVFTNLDVTTTTADAVRVVGNSLGTITFNTLDATTTDGDAVTLDNNANATLAVNNMTINVTGTGDGFTATGGGTLTGGGQNTVATNSGQGVNMSGMTIGAAGMRFDNVTVAAGAGNGISLATLNGTGAVIIGSPTGAAGSGGTLTTAGTAISVNNVDNLQINRIAITNTTGPGVNVTGQDGGTATFTGIEIETTTADGFTIANNTGGTITVNELDVETTDGDAVVLDNNAGATVNLNDITLESTGAGNGFMATGGGTIAVTGTNTIDTVTGQAVNIANQTIAAGGVRFDTVNATNATIAIELDTLTGGGVAIGSGVNPGDGGTLVASDTAIRVNDVDNATFSNITINNTAANSDGVIVTNSAGDRAFFSGMDITSERVGFSATGGELAVTGTNTISTTSGPALDLNNLVVNIAGVTFDNVSVSAGTGMGIELENLTGGTVTIGPNTGVDGDGGTLVTAGTSISVTNVENAVFNDMDVDSSASDAVTVVHTNATDSNVQLDNLTVTGASAAGVAITAGGAGEFDVALRDSTIAAVGTEGVSLNTDAGSDRVDLTLTNNEITAADASAFEAILDGGTGDVRFLFEDNEFTNDSATEATLDISVTAALELNATIEDNTFTNSNAGGTAFEMLVNEATDAAMIDLNLDGNTANLGAGIGNGAYDLTETAAMGSFRVVDVATADASNTGTVTFTPLIGDFDDITVGDVALPD